MKFSKRLDQLEKQAECGGGLGIPDILTELFLIARRVSRDNKHLHDAIKNIDRYEYGHHNYEPDRRMGATKDGEWVKLDDLESMLGTDD